jgi:HD domain
MQTSLTKDQKLRWTATGLAVLALIATTVSFAAQGFDVGRSWQSIAVLGVLAAIVTNLDIDIAESVGVSADVMIFIAAVVVLRDTGSVAGVALVGAFGGLGLSHLREREWYKVAINASVCCLALISAATVVAVGAGAGPVSPRLLVLTAVVGAFVYLLANIMMGSGPVSIAVDESYWAVVVQLTRSAPVAYGFAVLGVGLGWVYLELGPAVLVLFVVPILIARATFASYLEMKASQEQTIETLIHALEAKDHYTAGHAQRVAQFSEYVGEEFHFGPRRMERLRYAALMHDIGKLIVPNQILNKPGRLTEAEFERVKRHEPVSVELLGRIDFLAPVAGDTTTEAATAAVDGAGLIEPAIIHVADAFDAMTSTRSYRRALSQETAFEELRCGAGTQFNERCVAALITALEQRGERYGAGHEVDQQEWAVAPPDAGTGSAGLGHLVSEEQGTG